MAGAGTASGDWQVSAVFPCHNELANLERTLLGWHERLALRCSAHELIAVDDGSTDGSLAALRALERRIPELRVHRHPQRMGYGAALRSGLLRARFPLVLLCDGDGQFDPADLDRLLPHIADHDMVAGCRSPRRDSVYRRVLGRVFNSLLGRLFDVPLEDVNCALKLLWRDRFPIEELVSSGALINAELLLRTPHARIHSVPVRHLARRHGRATGGHPLVILEALRRAPLLFRLAVRRQPGSSR